MSINKKCLTLAFVFLCIFIAACTPAQTEDAPYLIRPASARVDTAFVDRGPVLELLRHDGITRYISEAVYFDNPVGAFGKFYVNPGDMVYEGQLLARLDTEYLEEQIAERTQRLATMRANNSLENERRQVAIDIMAIERARDIATAAENLDIAAAEAAEARDLAIEWAQMEARLERERQALALRHEEDRIRVLRDRASLAELRAPISGVVTYISDVRSGQHLSRAQPLIYLSDRSEIIVELVGLTVNDFAAIGLGPGWRLLATRDAVFTHAHIDGQIIELEYIVTALEDRHFRPAQFKLVNGDVLPPGLLFPVYFYTVKIDDAVRVPSNALFSGPGGLFVHRVINGELVHTDITIIARTTTLTAVAEGLEVGDEVFIRP